MTAPAVSTKIPIPSSLTSTTPSLPPLTSTLLLSHLRSTTLIPDLQSHLSDSLSRTGWTDRVRALALELLRSGQCETFPELFEEVLRRAKLDDTPSARMGGKSIPGQPKREVKEERSGEAIVVSRDWNGGPDGLPDVRVPRGVCGEVSEWLVGKVEEFVEVVDDE